MVHNRKIQRDKADQWLPGTGKCGVGQMWNDGLMGTGFLLFGW